MQVGEDEVLGTRLFTIVKGLHFAPEKSDRPTLVEETSKKSSYHLVEHQDTSGIIVAFLPLFYLLVLITTLQSIYR